jgi:hypothetical protein
MLLFDVPIARNTDPETSHASADITTKTDRATHCRKVLSLVYRRPGMIVAELESAYDGSIGKHDMTKRVSDLVRLGRAEYRGTKTNPSTGRSCGRVWPIRGLPQAH